MLRIDRFGWRYKVLLVLIVERANQDFLCQAWKIAIVRLGAVSVTNIFAVEISGAEVTDIADILQAYCRRLPQIAVENDRLWWKVSRGVSRDR